MATVLGLRNSAFAIDGLGRPAAISDRISRSRSVSSAKGLLAKGELAAGLTPAQRAEALALVHGIRNAVSAAKGA